MGIYSIGVSALQNAQLGLATASHNIANASTDGYNRQRIIQASSVATLTGSGYVGNGAQVTTIERIYSSFLVKQVNTAQTKVSELTAYSSSLTELNTLLSDSDSALQTALSSFFTSISTSTNSDPSSVTARQTMVSAAETLTSRFQSLDATLDAQYDSVNSLVQNYVSSINTYSQQIADLNTQIIKAGAANGQTPNDLLDQRDQLVAELNELVGVQTTTNSNGSINVFFGNGQQLVVGNKATTLTTVASSEDPTRLTVGIVSSSGTQELPESVISGGALAGVLSYRSESLDTAANELGRIAASVSLAFNAQHALGQDLLGSIEGDDSFVSDFFTISSPTVVANTNNSAGSATVTADYEAASYSDDGTFYTNLTTSDYRLTYDGTTLTLTRLSDNVSWTGTTVDEINDAMAASSSGSQGFTLSSSGTFVAGSSYLIQPTKYAAQSIEVNSEISSDVRLVAVAAPIRTAVGSDNTGSATISEGSVVTGYVAPDDGSPVTLTYSSSDGGLTGFSAYPVTVSVDGVETTYTSGTVPYTSGATYTFNGISFTMTGAPGDGDTFTIERNTNGVSDNRNALLLAQLQTGKTMAGNTATFATIYSQMVSNLGNQGSAAETMLTAQTTVLTEAQEARDSLSGVNLDEEAVDLIEYQQAYQAAAKMLQIASDLFDSILAIG